MRYEQCFCNIKVLLITPILEYFGKEVFQIPFLKYLEGRELKQHYGVDLQNEFRKMVS